MILSILTRRTAIRDPDEWDKRAAALLERIRPWMERQPGFAGIEIRREGQELIETTHWESAQDCERYVRDGGAAMAATVADALLPTAPYPNGMWKRETRST
jgi:hypothetical protein